MSPPPHGGYVSLWIKISWTIFEKGHPRNIPVKLFPNQTRGFREDFLRISLCRYISKSLSPMVAMFLDGSKFCKHFSKRVTKGTILWNYFKSWRGFRGEEFWRISLKCTQWKKPTPTAAMFFDRSKFHEHFSKRVTQGTILWNYFKIRPEVSEEKIFKKFLKKFH